MVSAVFCKKQRFLFIQYSICNHYKNYIQILLDKHILGTSLIFVYFTILWELHRLLGQTENDRMVTDGKFRGI